MSDRSRFLSFHSGNYIRNFIFGVEDSLVSTVGLLSGISAGGLDHKSIITSGIVLIAVEALSMGIGSYLSESSTEEYLSHRSAAAGPAAVGGLIMFVSYAVAGLIPLLPYFYFTGVQAFSVSILLTLAALFVLGLFSGRLSRLSVWYSAWRMFWLGGLAVAVGVLVGIFFN